ncbi:MAG: O-succinylhomoserine sulfhydrylase [Spirochaetaceae bacterium]|nr:MAG: O-succinylhomoserine sulfhydrylase [Spirochaetaceae bacterium]
MNESSGHERRGFETDAIRIQAERSVHREHSVPVYLTSSFLFDDAEHGRALFAEEADGAIYSRYSNPNVDEFVRKLCVMENCDDGVATATGMAAMFATFASFLNAGDHVVASRAVFGSSRQILTRILPRWGIEHTYVDPTDPREWKRAVKPNTKMFFAETPSNPGLELVDLEQVGVLAAENKALFAVDNCFATPYIQTPRAFGADIVAHSATKLIDGQGRVLGGAVLGTEKAMVEARFFARQTGPALSPFNAWLLSKSLETLGVRLDRHCANAAAVAEFLESHPKVTWVRYPFLASHPQYELARKQMRLGGALVTFELSGGIDGGKRFLDALRLFSLTANLGDTRSIATHPASTTHSKLTEQERLAVNITPGTVRLSVGIETLEDILTDLDRALSSV